MKNKPIGHEKMVELDVKMLIFIGLAMAILKYHRYIHIWSNHVVNVSLEKTCGRLIIQKKNNIDWPEVTFNTDSSSYVLFSDDIGGQKKAAARIINKYTNDSNKQILFDIELQDEKKSVIKGVTGQQLQLQSEQELEMAEVFYKANCLAKVICDKSKNNMIVGLHFMGPNAGEVVQGFALAVAMGATKEQFDNLVGIHPTAAEEFTVLSVSKESNLSLLKAAGCGGGSCG